MSGGGMGFIFDPIVRAAAQDRMQQIMSQAKAELESALPFAMEPVVYDFSINERGTWGTLLGGDARGRPERPFMPAGYYAMVVPELVRLDRRQLPVSRRAELNLFASAARHSPRTRRHGADPVRPAAAIPRHAATAAAARTRSKRCSPRTASTRSSTSRSARTCAPGGSAWPRTACRPTATSATSDPTTSLMPARAWRRLAAYRQAGLERLAAGAVAVVSLAGGVGTRWTQGAGVVKALHPFCRLGGQHRSFIEVHLAKSRRIGRLAGAALPHVVTTSYLTHDRIAGYLAREDNYGYPGRCTSRRAGRSGCGIVPMARDLRFAWEEMPQQILDEQAQKVRESLHAALIGWASRDGRGQRLHRQPAARSACTRWVTGTRRRTCSRTACWPRCCVSGPACST